MVMGDRAVCQCRGIVPAKPLPQPFKLGAYILELERFNLAAEGVNLAGIRD